MRVVGVDLAWGARACTGVCVVEDGRVLDSACLRSDDEIAAWIRRWDEGELLVAFDAPLIVRNPTGRRPCENVMASAFAAERAVPYPANLTLLKSDVRAARLARRFRLRVAPDAARERPLRAAIEVFPHPALVVFLARSERLPYKAKPGRSPAVRHAAVTWSRARRDCSSRPGGSSETTTASLRRSSSMRASRNHWPSTSITRRGVTSDDVRLRRPYWPSKYPNLLAAIR